jgi:60 kDa SS-A/Ro ribonucleoprotein
MDYSQHYSTLATPQSEQADPRQVKNSAGGYSFQVNDWQRLERFLILGSEGGSYYARERALTRDNAAVVERCLAEDPLRTVRMIVDVSKAGRAVKNDPAIFALAMASAKSGLPANLALARLPSVCRTGTHLFQFCQMVGTFRGWGRGLRRKVAAWYESKDERDLCYQLCKYQQRGGWSHRDVFRKAHPNAPAAISRWVVGAELGPRKIGVREYLPTGELPAYLQAFEELKHADKRRTTQLVLEHRFTHEMIASEHKNSPEVWEALLVDMPMGAMVRNLGKMTEVGLLKPMSAAAKVVADRLGDVHRIGRARLHPIALLSAQRVYASGKGARGSLTWMPVPQVIDALNEAFYLAFEAVEPTGKRTLKAIDVSGSMTWSHPIPGLDCRTIAAALAMVSARQEEHWHVVSFSGDLRPLPITPKQRLDDVIRTVDSVHAGSTDCSLPMLYAAGENLDVDLFEVYTDNETWAGRIHPHQAIKAYREKSGINAKLAVVAMVSNGFSIADPTDPGMIDLVGCDTATPQVLAEFARLG